MSYEYYPTPLSGCEAKLVCSKMSIVDHHHGKGRVRVAKRVVDPKTGTNYFYDFNCEVLHLHAISMTLWALQVSTWSPDCEKSFLVGDNSSVHPCVYIYPESPSRRSAGRRHRHVQEHCVYRGQGSTLPAACAHRALLTRAAGMHHHVTRGVRHRVRPTPHWGHYSPTPTSPLSPCHTRSYAERFLEKYPFITRTRARVKQVECGCHAVCPCVSDCFTCRSACDVARHVCAGRETVRENE